MYVCMYVYIYYGEAIHQRCRQVYIYAYIPKMQGWYTNLWLGEYIYIYIYIYTNLSMYTNMYFKLTCVTYCAPHKH